MTDIDLKQFCSTDETRPYLLAPFSVGGFTYATNGHILVRVPRREDAPEQTKKGKWDGPLVGLEEASFGTPAFTLPAQPPQAEECEECDGCGYEHDCPHCECTCRACAGSGSAGVEGNYSTTYEGVIFALRYVRKMLSLPGVELAKPKADDAPLLFRFEGGVGAVMPMRGESPNHIKVFGSHD